MVLLLVNYQGSEIIGLAAGESQNPMQTIPRAIKTVTLRILLIYIIPVFFLVVIFPWQKAGLSQSVFADALSFYGLKWAGIVISFVTVTAAISCSNSGFYGTVRAMLALSRKGMAPKALSKLNNHYMPQRAVFLTLFGVWAILLTSYFFGDTSLYLALLLVSGFTGTLCWIGLCWAQINFRRRLKSRGYSIKDLKYVTPGSPYTGMLAIFLMLCCLIFLFFAPDPTYKIAFGIGCTTLILPIIFYKLCSKFKPHWITPIRHPGEKKFIGFDALFPPKFPPKDHQE
jgi:AAT family amino acid transporter